MAVARKCDRCGQLFELPKEKELAGFAWLLGAGPTFEPGEVEYGKAYDLCPDCTDALSDWMECKTDPEEKPAEIMEDTRSPFERMTPEEYAKYLQETQPPKPEPEKIPYEKPVVGDSVEEVAQEKGFVSLLEEEEIAEAPQSEPEPTDEEIPEEPEERGEVVTSKPDEPESVSLGREMEKDFFTGMTYGEIADKYGVNKKKVTNSLHAFKKRCPDEYAEIALGANR